MQDTGPPGSSLPTPGLAIIYKWQNLNVGQAQRSVRVKSLVLKGVVRIKSVDRAPRSVDRVLRSATLRQSHADILKK